MRAKKLVEILFSDECFLIKNMNYAWFQFNSLYGSTTI